MNKKLTERLTGLDKMEELDWGQDVGAEIIDNNLEYDLMRSEYILNKIFDDTYAQSLYAALCNNSFIKIDEENENNIWDCSWRYAGSIVARLQQKGCYLNWYVNLDNNGIPEGTVTDEILEDLNKLGWKLHIK